MYNVVLIPKISANMMLHITLVLTLFIAVKAQICPTGMYYESVGAICTNCVAGYACPGK